MTLKKFSDIISTYSQKEEYFMSLQAAEQFEENGQYEEAYEEYKKVYAHNPNDLSLLAQLGHIAMMLKKTDEAEGYYHKMLTLDATNPTAYEQLMDIYIDTDKYKYYVYRGNLHSIEQKYEHALHDFKKAVANAGDDHEAISSVRFILGTLYEQLGNPTKAIDEYLKVLDYDHSHEEVYTRLANLYVMDDVIGSAIETLERARKEGFDTENICENLAQLYLKNNAPEKAKEVTKNELTKIKAMLAMGETIDAAKELERVKDTYKDNSQLYALQAEYYYTEKEYDKALEAVKKFAELSPNHPLIFQMSALIYEAKNDEYNSTLNWGRYNLVRGNKDIAINEFLNAYQLKDDDANLIATLANLLETSGEKHQAMEFYEKLVKLEPNNRSALEKLAKYWEDLGNYTSAIDNLEMLLEADKRNFNAMKRLAALYEKVKDKPNAVAMYKKYLQTAPQNEEYKQIERKLAKLENTEMQPDIEEEGLLDKIMKLFNK